MYFQRNVFSVITDGCKKPKKPILKKKTSANSTTVNPPI